MFKQLSVYRFHNCNDLDDTNVDVELFASDFFLADEIISKFPPADPAPGQWYHLGVSPIDDITLANTAQGGRHEAFVPLTVVKREKSLSNGAISHVTQAKVKEFEKDEGRPSSRKERTDIKYDVTNDLLKKAPIQETRVSGYVTADGWILINACGKAAEEYVSFLREMVGSLVAYPVQEFDDFPDVLQVNDFAKYLLGQFIDLEIEETNYDFHSVGSFRFTHEEEKITLNDAEASTVAEVLAHINTQNFDVGWIAINSEHAVFRLTEKFELKSIKLHDLSYEPENDQEDGLLTSGYHRFYLRFFRELFNQVACSVNKCEVNEVKTREDEGDE